jgi:hypothetical protein
MYAGDERSSEAKGGKQARAEGRAPKTKYGLETRHCGCAPKEAATRRMAKAKPIKA